MAKRSEAAAKRRVSRKHVSRNKKRTSRKRVTKKRTNRKRVTKKKTSRRRVSKKRKSKKVGKRGQSRITKKQCKKHLAKKVKVNMGEWHDGKYVSQKQALAVSYNQIKKEYPGCSKFFYYPRN